jgi:hypothetical protein
MRKRLKDAEKKGKTGNVSEHAVTVELEPPYKGLRLRVTDVQGPSELVNVALKQLETNLFILYRKTGYYARGEFRALEQRIKKRRQSNSRAPAGAIYAQYIDSISRLLADSFGDLLEIGVSNPEYGGIDPATWARSLLAAAQQ